jgi:hypothetical protein
MTVLPSSLVGKILASIWITACASVLIFAFVNRDITDTDVVVLSAMLLLTLPTGMAFIGLASLIAMTLDSMLGVTLPGGFIMNLAVWVPMTILGYVQWFLLLPAMFRRA